MEETCKICRITTECVPVRFLNKELRMYLVSNCDRKVYDSVCTNCIWHADFELRSLQEFPGDFYGHSNQGRCDADQDP